MIRRLLVGLAALALCGCGGGRANLDPGILRASAIYGSSAQGFRLTSTPTGATITFPKVTAGGTFLSLELPAGASVNSESWNGDADTLHLLASSGRLTQLGLVATKGYKGQPVSVDIRLGPAGRSVSKAPGGPRNNIVDLTVANVASGQARLSWTEVNQGDYDFNGEVNIADLAPLGQALGQGYSRSMPNAAQHAIYWVDGNGDGLVSIADLTPIGANLGNQVGGYVVKRNGARLGNPADPFTIPASLGVARPKLPRLQSYTAPGSASDSWQVQTVDFAGAGGSGNDGAQSGVDVRLNVSISGLSLLDATGFDGKESSAVGDSIMRIVYPGDIIDSIELPGLGQRDFYSYDQTTYSGLPRGVPLCADIIYVPSADLASGSARTVSAAGAEYPQDYYVYTRVPFVLPAGSATLDLDAQINLVPNPAGGYFVDLAATQTIGGASTTSHSRLDFKNSLVSLDSDGDGSYNDEPWLSDSGHINMSDSLRARLVAETTYANHAQGTLSGTVGAIDQASGTLVLASGSSEQLIGQPPVTLSGQTTLRFTEQTGFSQRIAGLGDSDLDVFGTLAVGDSVQVDLSKLTDAAQVPNTLRLADNVVRLSGPLADDTIYAVPQTTLAYPGQVVTVTVRTTLTASAFKSASSIEITYPAGCHYKPGSLNVGAPGGATWDPDGIWASLGTTQFDISPTDLSELTLPNGRHALRAALRAIDGTPTVGASGDIFNFQLVVDANADFSFQRGDLSSALTDYEDGSALHFWTHDDNAGQATIRVSGQRPQLALVGQPPAVGDGSSGAPYVVNAPIPPYQLELDSTGINVTSAADTVYTVAPATAGTVSAGGVLQLNDAYQGIVAVSATYQGIPNTDASTLFFSVGPQLFSAQVDRAATFDLGGIDTGNFTTVSTDHGSSIDVTVLGSGLSGLRGLYFDLPFDAAQYKYTGYDGVGALDDADARPLIAPASGPAPKLEGGQAVLHFGVAMAQPSAVTGFSGSGTLVTLHFDKGAGSYQQLAFSPPSGLINKPVCYSDGNGHIIWYYLNQGDANQDGVVDYRDFTQIAKSFGVTEPGFPDNSHEDVLDFNNDETIDLLDAGLVETNLDHRVQTYRVYASSSSSDYPDAGTPIDSVAFTAADSSGGGARKFFEFDISAEPYTYFWVKPVTDGVEGQVSQLCQVQ